MDKQDNWKMHIADTIREGGYINDTYAVLTLCKNAPNAIKDLVNYGVKFHKEINGKITQRFFGAATYRRACFSGDHTGKEILNSLVNQVEKRKIRFLDEVYIFSLLKKNNCVNGAIGLDLKTGKIIIFNAKIIILCTGGFSRVFERSSSRFWENNGDGIKLAYDVNAKFMDMEMFQFHPTGMVYPKKAQGILVTEAVRGEGGILLNNKNERFMRKYDKKRMELSARDIVARAVYSEIKKGNGTKNHGVYLDITSKTKDYILKRLPKMYWQFKKYANIDISKEKMEVAPTAHYSMGGVYVDHKTGKTSVKNLFAIGEITSGVHGANRLGGNSLAEIIVFGKLTARNAIKDLKKIKFLDLDSTLIRKFIKKFYDNLNSNGKDSLKIKKKIQDIMWKNVGVVRNGKDMRNALEELQKIKKIKLKTGKKLKNNLKLIAALDVINMIPTCEMIIKSALFRKESRGAHYREDFPKTLSKYKLNIVCYLENGEIKSTTRKIPEIPNDIKRYLNKGVNVHLLE